jgi:hypothetical protein
MPNSLSKVPLGSLLQAENTVVSYNGLLSVRRGIKQFGTSLASLIGNNPNTNVFEEFFYKGSKLAWFGDSTVSRLAPTKHYFAYDTNALGAWALTSSAVPAPAYALTDAYRSAQSNNNIYFTSVNGILKTDDPANALYSAGGLPGLDGLAALVDVAGFMANNTQVAYRMTWKTTDTNHNTIEGTPSTRVVIANTSGGTRNVQLTFTIPHGATVNDQWVLYRSPMSASSTTEPSDELQQVDQGYPSPTDITNGFFVATDTTPESQLGAALYTNSGQQGAAQANNIPPLANDMCFFVGYMIYAAATTQQKFLLSLLATGAPNGIQNGDTFTITNGASSFTLTGAAAENVATAHFKVFTGGDPGSDILQTKQSLIHVLNRQSQILVYAYDATDASSATSLPGDFFLQEQNIGGGIFKVSSSRSTCWNPVLTTTPADNESLAGGGLGSGFCSKFQQPEAVPVSNTINVGNPNFEWLRCLALRNSVIALKADGLFQLTGTTYPFTVTTLDTGTILTAPESCAAMSNQVYAYTNQGVVAIAETGPGIISRPIENILQRISSDLYPNFPVVTFGTAYETDRKFLLSTISASDGYQKATIQYVYDTLTESWTEYIYPVPVWDILESPTEHRLYVASASSAYPYLFQERKSYTNTDFADIELPVTITAFNNTNPAQYTVDLTSTTNVTVGWSLAQLVPGATNTPPQILNLTVITAILSPTRIAVRDAINWALSGSVFTTIEQPIPVRVQYCPISGGTNGNNPSIIKFFKEARFFFQDANFNSVDINFSSNFVQTGTTVSLTPIPASIGWGQFQWGQIPWGGQDEFTVSSVRTYIPLSARRANWLNLRLSLNEAMVGFTYGGCVLQYMDKTTRSK